MSIRSSSDVIRRRAMLVCAGLALLGAGAVAGCGGEEKKKAPAAKTGAAGKDKGDFKLVLEEPENTDDEDAAVFVEEGEIAKTLVDAVNAAVALPGDVTVGFASTDEGPAYDPSSRTIVFGYPFVTYIAQTFAESDPEISEEDLQTNTNDVLGFVLIHEMGHALVDQLNLPITGREEDAVDNLATYLTVAIDETGRIALDFADFFSILQEDPSQLTEVDFWDEHSLDVQRANQTACLVYGSDPEALSGLEEFIPEERAVRCPDEWAQVRDSWEKLLEPYALD